MEKYTKGYGVIVRLFHVVLAFMIIGQLSVGIYMVGLPNNMKAGIYADHKMYGFMVMVIVILRMSWRLMNTLPSLPETTLKWQQVAARSLHRVFYKVVGNAITGWMMSTAAGYLPSFLGLENLFSFFQS